jgi:hypothetical protein
MNINKLTEEELKYIIDNIEEIKSQYSNKYEVHEDDVYFRNMSRLDRESYLIAIVTEVEDSMVSFSEFDIVNDSFHLYTVRKSKEEFLEEFTKVDFKMQFELLKLYDNKKEIMDNIEKNYYLRAKDILHEYKLI